MELSSISAQVLYTAIINRGIKVEIISKKFNLMKIKVGNKFLYLKSTAFPVNPHPSCIIANNKYLTKKILNKNNVPVLKSWFITNITDASKLSNNLNIYPCVLKPIRGSHGNRVFANVQTSEEFKSLLKFLFPGNKDADILVEKYEAGYDYRLLVVKDEVVAVVQRIPAHVIGNGTSTIARLIKKHNTNPLVGLKYEKPLCKILLDVEVKRTLKKTGKNFLYIPSKGEVVYLRQNANISTGGISVDVTDDITLSIKNTAVRASKSLGMVISGVDIIYNNITNKAYVLEVNDTPGIDIHHYPLFGKSRKVADAIVQCLLNSIT